MTSDELIKQVDRYFEDTKRSQRETLDGLCEANEHIQMLIDSIGDPEDEED